MYQSADLEVWNLTPRVPVFVGPQNVFNVLGRLKSPYQASALFYSLNGEAETPVFFKNAINDSLRLERLGDFNIDTIDADDLKRDNSLSLRLTNGRSQETKYEINFPTHLYRPEGPKFVLNLAEVKYAEQVGQVVDGKWRISEDETVERCLEIGREDAGYDRIILFGSQEWTSGYEITARICVTAWTEIEDHGVGVAFKWNPHLRGDGTCLPSQWNTGVGMYYSHAASLRAPLGLRLAFGVTASNGASAQFHHYLLKQRPFSLWRKELSRIARPVIGTGHLFPQIVSNRQYRLSMKVCPERLALTVWRDGKKEPAPQVYVSEPLDRLPRGSVGIIAHHCAVRVYEFAVVPDDQTFRGH
jgi:hypothetical protein